MMDQTAREGPVWYVPQSRAGLRLRCTLRKSGDSAEILLTGTGFLRMQDIFVYIDSDFLPDDQSLELARAMERLPHTYLFGRLEGTECLKKATSDLIWADMKNYNWGIFSENSDRKDKQDRFFYGLGHSRELYLRVPPDMIGSLSAPPAFRTLLQGAKRVRLRIMVTHNKLVVLGGPDFYKTMGVSWRIRTSDQSRMLVMQCEDDDDDDDDDDDNDDDDDAETANAADIERIRRQLVRLMDGR